MHAARAIEFAANESTRRASELASVAIASGTKASAEAVEDLLASVEELEPIYRKMREAYDEAIRGHHDVWELFAVDGDT